MASAAVCVGARLANLQDSASGRAHGPAAALRHDREMLRIVTASAPDEMVEGRSGWCASDYEVLSILSASPVRSLLRARCRFSGEEVCLKVYDKRNLVAEGRGRTGEVMSARQVLREIHNHSQADHPGIVTCYGAFETDRAYFMVLELCECSLRDILDTQGILRTKHAKQIIAQLLEALIYIHGKGVMHGDIKPENILLSFNGDPKLADFSLSMDVKLEQPCQPRGSLCYCAPEVVEGVDDADERTSSSDSSASQSSCMYATKSDVWAAGVCTYELIAGHSLFNQYSRDICLAQIRSLSLDLSALSHRQAAFISAALVADQARRPTSAELALHPWLQASCKAAPPSSWRWAQLPSLPSLTNHPSLATLTTTTYWRKLLHI